MKIMSNQLPQQEHVEELEKKIGLLSAAIKKQDLKINILATGTFTLLAVGLVVIFTFLL